MKPSPSAVALDRLAPKAAPSLRQRAFSQLRIVLVITAVFTALETLVFGQPTGQSLLYTFVISCCCSLIIQGLSQLMLYGLNRSLPAHTEPRIWLGWPLQSACLIVGTLLGYSLGNALANWISGHQNVGLVDVSLRQGLVILVISLIPGVAVTLYFVGRGRVEAAHALALKAQRSAAENQLRLLQSQLEPHMLFNTLANLRVLIGMDPARAQHMLDQLIAYLRATLTASRAESHPLRDEFERLRDYLALMQIRMGQRLRPSLELPAELAEFPIAPLLLQPLVENAIKHGLEPAIDGGELSVRALRMGSHLQLDVLDTGIGIGINSSASPDTRTADELPPGAESGTHFGLHQVRERLATQYGSQASLSISPAPQGGTLARILIPIQNP
ncbi:sensor histidine kinase [Paucibacter sp. Y2R2-4]|uniref:sensor histidine kinase n=1 Tax=Paucibacter sp. Y2R2-4 TaxID=2893553 RepID=UPI0021E4E82B|nr:histidine kinase [Paucibacter sp. Y2R2-4]MCV2351909.1 histidine kinase [Paucibacter sp. Y2R2-4]